MTLFEIYPTQELNYVVIVPDDRGLYCFELP